MAKGHRVVLIEDLVSTGMSSLKCAEALRAEGAEVPAVLALFSYGLPQAEAAFAAARIEVAVLSSFEVLSAEAEARGILDIAGSDALAAWRSGRSRRWPATVPHALAAHGHAHRAVHAQRRPGACTPPPPAQTRRPCCRSSMTSSCWGPSWPRRRPARSCWGPA